MLLCDEIWSFCYAKAKNVKHAKAAPEHAGDVWAWTALHSDSKMILSYLVGDRDAEYALAFMDDVRSRPVNRVQLTTEAVKMSPAMAAGVSTHIWEMADIVAPIDAAAPIPAKRGPYRKRVAA